MLHVFKPSAQTHTAAPHCGSQCHPAPRSFNTPCSVAAGSGAKAGCEVALRNTSGGIRGLRSCPWRPLQLDGAAGAPDGINAELATMKTDDFSQARPEHYPRPALRSAHSYAATGQCRVTLSLRQEKLRAVCGLRQEERILKRARRAHKRLRLGLSAI